MDGSLYNNQLGAASNYRNKDPFGAYRQVILRSDLHVTRSGTCAMSGFLLCSINVGHVLCLGFNVFT